MPQSDFDFPIGTYRFLFRGRGVLPAGFGLAQWRGQIGLALYRTACIVEAPDCLQADCEFHTGCAYTRVFRGIGVEAAGAGSAQGNTPPQPRAFVHRFVTRLIRKAQVALTVYHPLAESGGEIIEAWKRARDEIYPVAFAVRRARPGKHKSISLGGYLGRFELAGPGLQALMPLLILGQYIHAGKKATYGNGAFSLQPAHA